LPRPAAAGAGEEIAELGDDDGPPGLPGKPQRDGDVEIAGDEKDVGRRLFRPCGKGGAKALA
jgi:hypothetical protein